MNRAGTHLIVQIPDPFDGSSRARLARMGLIDCSGELIISAMAVFADIFTGLFYDDLRDYHANTEYQLTLFKTFGALYKKEDYQHMYLLISIQYDYMRKPLPDPVWWLAGESAAVKAFMTLFIERYERFIQEDGMLQHNEGVETC